MEYCLVKTVYMEITKWYLKYENKGKCHIVRKPELVHRIIELLGLEGTLKII